MTRRTSPGSLRRRTAVIAGSAALATAALAATGLTAKAAHPTSSSGSTLTLMTANPAYGGLASFSFAGPPVKGVQEMSVACTQSGTQVYLDVHTQNQADWTNFQLWSQSWQDAGGGAVSCTADLYYYTWQGKTETGVVHEAETSFDAS